ncbi:hypothetical protein QCA50_012568 [Cerrena zonata]|uniref:Uncharacterized protein n=1 Tax=Cerrena zonata TaxID=2478898 RepID=A0AAW0FYS3_9APHY
MFLDNYSPTGSPECDRGNRQHEQIKTAGVGASWVMTNELTIDPYTIIKEGVKRVADTQNPTILQHRNYAAFMALGRHVNTLLQDVYGNPQAQQEVAQSIRDGASGARSDDTNQMKRDLLDWIKDSLVASRMPLHPKNMLNRGHHHPDTRRLLAPAVLGPWNPAMQQALDWNRQDR